MRRILLKRKSALICMSLGCGRRIVMKKNALALIAAVLFLSVSSNVFAAATVCNGVDCYYYFDHWLSDEAWGDEVSDFTTASKIYCNVSADYGLPVPDNPPVPELRWFNPSGDPVTPSTLIYKYSSGILAGFYGWLDIAGIYREPGEWRVEHWVYGYRAGVGTGYHKLFTAYFTVPLRAELSISPESFHYFEFADSFDAPGSSPMGLAFDGTYLWNADDSDDKIYKLNTSGTIIDSFDSPGSSPMGLTFDGTYLWNTDISDEKIYKLDTFGTIIDSFNSPGYYPHGLAFDGTYLWNADGYKIYKLWGFERIIESFDSPYYAPSLAFDGTYLWLAEGSYDGKIYKLDTSGTIIDSFDSPGDFPRGLAFDGTYLWNADDSVFDDIIYKLDTSGTIIDSFDSPGKCPEGLTFDGTYLWHGDSCDDKIYKLDTSGAIIDSFDSPGLYPTDLAFDGTYLWLVDSILDAKIYKLDTSGTVIDSFDSPGESPMGLTFDGTYLWNADYSDEKVYKLNLSERIIDSIDSPGSYPTGLAFDGTYLWNADNGDEKIYKLNTSGSILNSFDFPGLSPTGLAFDGMYFWNADNEEDKIYKLEKQGVYISSSSTQTFTITSVFNDDLEIGTFTITGANASEFGIENDTCSGQTLAPAETCTFDVVFSPSSAGEKSAFLEISSNDPFSPKILQLTGKGVKPWVKPKAMPWIHLLLLND